MGIELEDNCYRSVILRKTILGLNGEASNFKDKYELGEQLGWGQFGIIRSCSDRDTGDVFACKSIAKNRLTTNDDVRGVKLEIEIMSKLSGHPNVVDLKSVYEDEDYVHLVMELCAGGELFHQLKRFGRYPEHEAKVLFRHLMQVVMHCHEMGIVHRDLKPENILLSTKSLSSPIKLADFGLATYTKPGQSLHGTVGSPFYIAPEVLVGGYNQAADVWSAGVILYILLSGMPPFWGKTKSKIFDAVRAAILHFPPDLWDHLSPSARDLITRMLCVDPAKRLTAKEVLDHCWMKDCSHQTQEPNTPNFLNRERLGTGNNSFSTPFSRAQDFSFSDKMPSTLDGRGEDLTTFTCRSSFSSLLIQSGTPHFSFTSCRDSSFAEFSSPISSMPSFTFFTPFSVVKQGNISLGTKTPALEFSFGDSRLEKQVFLFDPSPFTKFQIPEEEQANENRRGARTVTVSSKASSISNKRNHTIELGGLNQLDLDVASEAVIRWASCTHISTTSSFLRSSLVC